MNIRETIHSDEFSDACIGIGLTAFGFCVGAIVMVTAVVQKASVTGATAFSPQTMHITTNELLYLRDAVGGVGLLITLVAFACYLYLDVLGGE